jgi:hypothetical protein
MPGLVPGIHVLLSASRKAWMAGHQGVYARLSTGYCPAMTKKN